MRELSAYDCYLISKHPSIWINKISKQGLLYTIIFIDSPFPPYKVHCLLQTLKFLIILSIFVFGLLSKWFSFMHEYAIHIFWYYIVINIWGFFCDIVLDNHSAHSLHIPDLPIFSSIFTIMLSCLHTAYHPLVCTLDIYPLYRTLLFLLLV